MWYTFLFCLISTAQAGDILLRQDTPQIARNISGYTAYDVLNYTSANLDDSPKIEVPLRILCVGDSITEGWGSDSNGGDGNGYRLSLAEHLSRESYWIRRWLLGICIDSHIGEDVVFAGTRHRGSMEDSYHVSLELRDKDVILIQIPRQHGPERLSST